MVARTVAKLPRTLKFRFPAPHSVAFILVIVLGIKLDIRLAAEEKACLHRLYSATVPEYSWLADENQRQMAQVNFGNMARLHAAASRYMDGQNLTVVFLGGSIAAGQGSFDMNSDSKAFPMWAEQILHGALGSRAHVHNGAVPGTLSSYMSVCHNVHVPTLADVIILDYTINDPETMSHRRGFQMDCPARRSFERLLRKLLNYPRRPAVLLIHAFRWFRLAGEPGTFDGSYWPGNERDFHDFALYYGLQELSVKAAAWNLMRRGAHGFNVNFTRGDNGNLRAEDDVVRGNAFYWDIIHPDGHTGHKFMGEISAQALLDAVASVQALPMTEQELAAVDSPMPPPMITDNWESASDKCFIGQLFVKAVVQHEGWEYKDEGKHSSRPKLGFISEQPGTALRLKINTTSSLMPGKGRKVDKVTVEVAFLKSYENMGRASVTCEIGCSCRPSKLDGHHAQKSSQLNLHEFRATQHDECVVTITVLAETTSGKHKVKIAGIMVSEEGGVGVANGGAVEMASDGSNWSREKEGGTYDIRQWISGVPFKEETPEA